MKKEPYTTPIQPTWCPGCGNFGILLSLKKAFSQLKLPPHQVVVVTDVGCSGNMADFIRCYVFHALHGRALPPAAGIKLANHRLTVVAVIGDGGCYGEGLTHLINLMRGNHDITVIVHDNGLYSLTTGQASPTTPQGQPTKSTPEGVIEKPLNPLALALANHTTFAARGYAYQTTQLTQLLVKAIRHPGFSFVDVLQPCVTFNQKLAKKWESKIKPLKKRPPTRLEALKLALDPNQLFTGLFWQEKRPPYHQKIPFLKTKPLVRYSIEKVTIEKLLEKFY